MPLFLFLFAFIWISDVRHSRMNQSAVSLHSYAYIIGRQSKSNEHGHQRAQKEAYVLGIETARFKITGFGTTARKYASSAVFSW